MNCPPPDPPSTPSQDALRAFLRRSPGATRDGIGQALRISYAGVVTLVERSSAWLRVEQEPGRAGRRSVWRYWARE